MHQRPDPAIVAQQVSGVSRPGTGATGPSRLRIGIRAVAASPGCKPLNFARMFHFHAAAQWLR
ncbi:MAG: hypothetical protein WCI74_15520, partial [Actinomycetes bacterium]